GPPDVSVSVDRNSPRIGSTTGYLDVVVGDLLGRGVELDDATGAATGSPNGSIAVHLHPVDPGTAADLDGRPALGGEIVVVDPLAEATADPEVAVLIQAHPVLAAAWIPQVGDL